MELFSLGLVTDVSELLCCCECVSNARPQTHTVEQQRQERQWVGGDTRKLRNIEQRVECPSSHDIIQMALSLDPT